MQQGISHQALGRLIVSPSTACSVMATGPASGPASARPSASRGGAVPGTAGAGILAAFGRGTSRCRGGIRACRGMVFAVTLASP